MGQPFFRSATSDMTVYSKTNTGRLLAFDQKPSVPQAMRDLLRRVDGKTPYHQLISQPGDAELFEELCQRQLVQIATEPWRNGSTANTSPVPSSSWRAAGNGPEELLLRLVGKPDDPRYGSKLETVKALMSSFVQTHLPTHADATLAEIRALTSEAELLCMFNGYINLVNPAGQAGQAHVQDLLLAISGDE